MNIRATGQLHHTDYKEFVLKIEQRIDEFGSIKSSVNMEDLVGRLQLYPDVPGVTCSAAYMIFKLPMVFTKHSIVRLAKLNVKAGTTNIQ